MTSVLLFFLKTCHICFYTVPEMYSIAFPFYSMGHFTLWCIQSTIVHSPGTNCSCLLQYLLTVCLYTKVESSMSYLIVS